MAVDGLETAAGAAALPAGAGPGGRFADGLAPGFGSERIFTDVEERLHGEEITRLRQKQAEYLALQNQINPHFLYNALEAIRTDALLANCPDIAETTEALATFSDTPSPMSRSM